VRDASATTRARSAWASQDRYLDTRARGHTGPVPATVSCGLLAIYFLVEAFEPFSLFRLALGLITSALTFRLALRTKLAAEQEGIVWHTLTRTRRWPYRMIDHFEVANRIDGQSGSSRRVLRVHLADGHAQWLRGLEDSDGSTPVRFERSGEPQTLDQLAARLNGIVEVNQRSARELEAS
jgi:hypothetical protein